MNCQSRRTAEAVTILYFKCTIEGYVCRDCKKTWKISVGTARGGGIEILTYQITGKVIPVTGHGDPYGCETSRLPHLLDNRLTDGGEVVSLTRRPPFSPKKFPGAHLC
jgi:hypothetical protein